MATLIGWLKDEKARRSVNQRAATYFALRIACMLDRYATECCNAILETKNHISSHGCIGSLHDRLPVFPDFPGDIEWKSVDPLLAMKILSFPNHVLEANRDIAFVNEVVSAPPDYDETFEESVKQCAQIGLEAWSLVKELKGKCGLPISGESKKGWSVEKYLSKVLSEIERENAKTPPKTP